jgi:polyhydroxyalkanoate synthase
MHRFYLREFYLHNRLVEADSLTLAGEPIDLGRIVQEGFMVAAEEDHIAPWKQAFKLAHHVSGPLTFTLSSSGHILGVINPPSPTSRRQYWQGTVARRMTPTHWRSEAMAESGSWWPGWVTWLNERCGPMVVPPPVSSRKYHQMADAPGTYVFE